MKKTIFCIATCLLWLVLFACTTQQPTEQSLSETSFAHPDRDYAPMTWWHWCNGNVTKQGIYNDLVAMDKNGMRGVQMFNAHMYLPKGAIEFGSDEWVDMVTYAVEVCDSLGMKFTCMNAAGWSGSGGPWITPERAMKKLVYSEQRVQGDVNMKLATPPTQDGFYRDIAVMALPARYPAGEIEQLDNKILMANPSALNTQTKVPTGVAVPIDSVLHLSHLVDSEGNIAWSAPDGEWTIIRFGYTLTGKKAHPNAWGGEGYECDKLDATHVAYQFEQSLGKLLAATRPYLGNTFEGILFDSYEAHYQNWTESLPTSFEESFGYDFTTFLPLFTGRYVASAARSERVLNDYRQLLDQLLAQNYYGTMQQLAHQHNLLLYAEAQGVVVNSSIATNYVDIPMNEFWMPDTEPRAKAIKYTASMGNMQNKQLIAAEAFTSKPEDAKWQNTPWRLKSAGDLAFACGINRYCFHSYAHQPVDHAIPGFTMGRYGAMFNRHLTWWNYAGDWFDYITRSQYMLQQGRTVADVLFLFHNDIRYNFSANSVKIPVGYDYRICYPQHLEGAVVEHGEVVLRTGARFKLLAIPAHTKMNLATLTQVERLVKEGATLVGDCPMGFFSESGWQDDTATVFTQLCDTLWGGRGNVNSYGKGVVYSHTNAYNLLADELVAPDISYGNSCASDSIRYLHRVVADDHFYYLTNQSRQAISTDITFRVPAGMTPQIWHPVTGEIIPITTKENTPTYTTISYDFAPVEAVFVVFRKTIEKDKTPPAIMTLKACQEVDGDWSINFVDPKQQIEHPVVTPHLFLWNESENEKIKYYAGTAIYTTTVKVSAEMLHNCEKAQLSLGSELYDIASVKVNDSYVGTVWAKPYTIEVGSQLKEGENKLEIAVANTWINRIIGDERYPEDGEFDTQGSIFTKGRATKLPYWIYGDTIQPSNRQRITYATWKHYTATSPLVPSGLVGTVSISYFTAE